MIPSFSELMLPVLEEANSKIDVDTLQVEKSLADKFNLSQKERRLEKNSGTERLFLNKIRWAKTHLEFAGLIAYTLKNWYTITQRGIEFLKTKPLKITERTLYQFKEYVEKRLKILFEYEWCMPNKWTFKMKPAKEFIERETRGLTVDPSCGQSDFADIRNDINPDSKAHCNLDAFEFLKKIKSNFAETILLDLPYSSRQIAEGYKAVGIKVTQQHTQSSFYAKIKNEVARILKKDGIVISFGWNSCGLGKNRGFKKQKIKLLCHGSNHNDTIILLEKKCGM